MKDDRIIIKKEAIYKNAKENERMREREREREIEEDEEKNLF
mgnify:CR=1 FL=1